MRWKRVDVGVGLLRGVLEKAGEHSYVYGRKPGDTRIGKG